MQETSAGNLCNETTLKGCLVPLQAEAVFASLCKKKWQALFVIALETVCKTDHAFPLGSRASLMSSCIQISVVYYYLPTACFFHGIFLRLNVNVCCNSHVSVVAYCKKVEKTFLYGSRKGRAVHQELCAILDELKGICQALFHWHCVPFTILVPPSFAGLQIFPD